MEKMVGSANQEMKKSIIVELVNQSRLMTQIRTRPKATQQGVKCRCDVTVPAVPTQKAIPEESG